MSATQYLVLGTKLTYSWKCPSYRNFLRFIPILARWVFVNVTCPGSVGRFYKMATLLDKFQSRTHGKHYFYARYAGHLR